MHINAKKGGRISPAAKSCGALLNAEKLFLFIPLTDVNRVINRLWQIQSSLPLTAIDSILLSTDNQEYGKSRLRQFLCSPGLNRTVTANWHQRTFGMSRLR